MEDLESMKYADLRKVAKNVGIKANMKQEKLIMELKKYYSTCDKNENTDVKSRQEKANGKKHHLESSIDPVPVSCENASIQNQHYVLGGPLSAGKSFIGAVTEALKDSAKCQVLTPEVQEETQKSQSMKSSERWVKKVFTPTARCSVTNISNKLPAPPFMKEIGKRKQTKSALESQPPSKRQRGENLETTANQDLLSITVDASGANRNTCDEAAVEELLSSTGDSSMGRPRRNTFDKAPTPNLRTPEIVACTRSRRSTFEKAPTPDLNIPNIDNTLTKKVTRSSTSPFMKEMHGAMDSNMTNEQIKKSVMSVIDKPVQERVKAAPHQSNIPRFVQYARKLNQSKPVTPGNKNWEKIHTKNFDKLDSIDVYLKKKQKLAEEMTSSVKKANTILSEVQATVDKLKLHKTPEAFRNKFINKAKQSHVNGSTPFKPTVLSTSEMNLNFEDKKPSSQTLSRKTPIQNGAAQVKNVPALPPDRTSVGSVHPEQTTTTPFKFTGVANTTMNKTIGSAKKPFDLKASLAKPLTWKPHKGKLKPLEHPSESPAYLKVQTHEAKAKRMLMNREVCRAKVTQKRADIKNDAHMTRRGMKP